MVYLTTAIQESPICCPDQSSNLEPAWELLQMLKMILLNHNKPSTSIDALEMLKHEKLLTT
jgi:hypothetical protein